MTKIYMIDNIKLSNKREVRLIRINIVGSISNQDEITEIETIAKVFVVEKRMIDLTNEPVTGKIISEPPKKPIKKINKTPNSYNAHLPVLTVKGLN